MIKTSKTMAKQEKERYNVPRKVQDVIPEMCIRDRVNTVSFVDGIKYHRTAKDYYDMQRESDRLCREYGPVSYTHLDVYKRQPCLPTKWEPGKRMRWWRRQWK